MDRYTWDLWLKFYDDIKIDNPFFGNRAGRPAQESFEIFVTKLAKALKLRAPKFPKRKKGEDD